MRVSTIAMAVGLLAAALAVPMMIDLEHGVAGDASAGTICGAGWVHETSDGSSSTKCGLLYIGENNSA